MHAAHDDIDNGRNLVLLALAPYARMPSVENIVRMTDELLVHGRTLLGDAEALRAGDRRVEGALRDWRQLTADGPGDGPLGGWNHARGLARAIRILHWALDEKHGRRSTGSAGLLPLPTAFGVRPVTRDAEAPR